MRHYLSFSKILEQSRGVGPGFDLVRILLATLIFCGHAKAIAGHGEHASAAATHVLALTQGNWDGPRRPLQVSLVPMFFAVSGFLVAGSALRLKCTATFLAFRALRIFPALLVEVTLSALVLGPALTVLPLKAYFADSEFYRYFGNVLGLVSFTLPGVFVHNHWPNVVNANLWTLPAEFDCYFVIALLMLSGLLYDKKLFTVLFAVATLALVPLNVLTDFGVTETTMAPVVIDYYFLVGVLFYHYRDQIGFSRIAFCAACAVSYILLSFRHTEFLAPVFVTYVILFIGMTRFPEWPVLKTGDYSYGVYLYGFPITQALVTVFPQLKGHGWPTLIISAAVTCLFAVFSWHVIEKHMLALRKRLPARFFPTRPVILTEPAVRTELAAGSAPS